MSPAAEIDPSEVATAADAVARQQVGLAGAFRVLADRLTTVAGMAGDDRPGAAFATVYVPAARSTFFGFVAAVRILDGVTSALVTAGNNHARAEGASTVGGPTPELLARPQTSTPTVRKPAEPVGPGDPGPAELVSAYWPAAAPDLLLDAASSWRAAGAAVTDAVATLGTAVADLEATTSGPDVDAMVAFWTGLIGPGHTLFAELALLCIQLGDLCLRYGRLVDDTRRDVREAIGIMIATGLVAASTGIGLAVAAHVELGEIELLLRPAADRFAARLSAEVLTAVDPGLGASVDRLAAGTATPQAIEAELTELEDATDAGLGGTAIPPAGTGAPQAVPRFAAQLFATPDKAAVHTRDHAGEFGLTSEGGYTTAAADFLRHAQNGGAEALIDSTGTVRIYEPATNTMAVYDSMTGVIRTLFKPTSTTYWERNAPGWGRPVEWK